MSNIQVFNSVKANELDVGGPVKICGDIQLKDSNNQNTSLLEQLNCIKDQIAMLKEQQTTEHQNSDSMTIDIVNELHDSIFDMISSVNDNINNIGSVGEGEGVFEIAPYDCYKSINFIIYSPSNYNSQILSACNVSKMGTVDMSTIAPFNVPFILPYNESGLLEINHTAYSGYVPSFERDKLTSYFYDQYSNAIIQNANTFIKLKASGHVADSQDNNENNESSSNDSNNIIGSQKEKGGASTLDIYLYGGFINDLFQTMDNALRASGQLSQTAFSALGKDVVINTTRYFESEGGKNRFLRTNSLTKPTYSRFKRGAQLASFVGLGALATVVGGPFRTTFGNLFYGFHRLTHADKKTFVRPRVTSFIPFADTLGSRIKRYFNKAEEGELTLDERSADIADEEFVKFTNSNVGKNYRLNKSLEDNRFGFRDENSVSVDDHRNIRKNFAADTGENRSNITKFFWPPKYDREGNKLSKWHRVGTLATSVLSVANSITAIGGAIYALTLAIKGDDGATEAEAVLNFAGTVLTALTFIPPPVGAAFGAAGTLLSMIGSLVGPSRPTPAEQEVDAITSELQTVQKNITELIGSDTTRILNAIGSSMKQNNTKSTNDTNSILDMVSSSSSHRSITTSINALSLYKTKYYNYPAISFQAINNINADLMVSINENINQDIKILEESWDENIGKLSAHSVKLDMNLLISSFIILRLMWNLRRLALTYSPHYLLNNNGITPPPLIYRVDVTFYIFKDLNEKLNKLLALISNFKASLKDNVSSINIQKLRGNNKIPSLLQYNEYQGVVKNAIGQVLEQNLIPYGSEWKGVTSGNFKEFTYVNNNVLTKITGNPDLVGCQNITGGDIVIGYMMVEAIIPTMTFVTQDEDSSKKCSDRQQSFYNVMLSGGDLDSNPVGINSFTSSSQNKGILKTYGTQKAGVCFVFKSIGSNTTVPGVDFDSNGLNGLSGLNDFINENSSSLEFFNTISDSINAYNNTNRSSNVKNDIKFFVRHDDRNCSGDPESCGGTCFGACSDNSQSQYGNMTTILPSVSKIISELNNTSNKDEIQIETFCDGFGCNSRHWKFHSCFNANIGVLFNTGIAIKYNSSAKKYSVDENHFNDINKLYATIHTTPQGSLSLDASACDINKLTTFSNNPSNITFSPSLVPSPSTVDKYLLFKLNFNFILFSKNTEFGKCDQENICDKLFAPINIENKLPNEIFDNSLTIVSDKTTQNSQVGEFMLIDKTENNSCGITNNNLENDIVDLLNFNINSLIQNGTITPWDSDEDAKMELENIRSKSSASTLVDNIELTTLFTNYYIDNDGNLDCDNIPPEHIIDLEDIGIITKFNATVFENTTESINNYCSRDGNIELYIKEPIHVINYGETYGFNEEQINNKIGKLYWLLYHHCNNSTNTKENGIKSNLLQGATIVTLPPGPTNGLGTYDTIEGRYDTINSTLIHLEGTEDGFTAGILPSIFKNLVTDSLIGDYIVITNTSLTSDIIYGIRGYGYGEYSQLSPGYIIGNTGVTCALKEQFLDPLKLSNIIPYDIYPLNIKTEMLETYRSIQQNYVDLYSIYVNDLQNAVQSMKNNFSFYQPIVKLEEDFWKSQAKIFTLRTNEYSNQKIFINDTAKMPFDIYMSPSSKILELSSNFPLPLAKYKNKGLLSKLNLSLTTSEFIGQIKKAAIIVEIPDKINNTPFNINTYPLNILENIINPTVEKSNDEVFLYHTTYFVEKESLSLKKKVKSVVNGEDVRFSKKEYYTLNNIVLDNLSLDSVFKANLNNEGIVARGAANTDDMQTIGSVDNGAVHFMKTFGHMNINITIANPLEHLYPATGDTFAICDYDFRQHSELTNFLWGTPDWINGNEYGKYWPTNGTTTNFGINYLFPLNSYDNFYNITPIISFNGYINPTFSAVGDENITYQWQLNLNPHVYGLNSLDNAGPNPSLTDRVPNITKVFEDYTLYRNSMNIKSYAIWLNNPDNLGTTAVPLYTHQWNINDVTITGSTFKLNANHNLNISLKSDRLNLPNNLNIPFYMVHMSGQYDNKNYNTLDNIGTFTTEIGTDVSLITPGISNDNFNTLFPNLVFGGPDSLISDKLVIAPIAGSRSSFNSIYECPYVSGIIPGFKNNVDGTTFIGAPGFLGTTFSDIIAGVTVMDGSTYSYSTNFDYLVGSLNDDRYITPLLGNEILPTENITQDDEQHIFFYRSKEKFLPAVAINAKDNINNFLIQTKNNFSLLAYNNKPKNFIKYIPSDYNINLLYLSIQDEVTIQYKNAWKELENPLSFPTIRTMSPYMKKFFAFPFEYPSIYESSGINFENATKRILSDNIIQLYLDVPDIEKRDLTREIVIKPGINVFNKQDPIKKTDIEIMKSVGPPLQFISGYITKDSYSITFPKYNISALYLHITGGILPKKFSEARNEKTLYSNWTTDWYPIGKIINSEYFPQNDVTQAVSIYNDSNFDEICSNGKPINVGPGKDYEYDIYKSVMEPVFMVNSVGGASICRKNEHLQDIDNQNINMYSKDADVTLRPNEFIGGYLKIGKNGMISLQIQTNSPKTLCIRDLSVYVSWLHNGIFNTSETSSSFSNIKSINFKDHDNITKPPELQGITDHVDAFERVTLCGISGPNSGITTGSDLYSNLFQLKYSMNDTRQYNLNYNEIPNAKLNFPDEGFFERNNALMKNIQTSFTNTLLLNKLIIRHSGNALYDLIDYEETGLMSTLTEVNPNLSINLDLGNGRYWPLYPSINGYQDTGNFMSAANSPPWKMAWDNSLDITEEIHLPFDMDIDPINQILPDINNGKIIILADKISKWKTYNTQRFFNHFDPGNTGTTTEEFLDNVKIPIDLEFNLAINSLSDFVETKLQNTGVTYIGITNQLFEGDDIIQYNFPTPSDIEGKLETKKLLTSNRYVYDAANTLRRDGRCILNLGIDIPNGALIKGITLSKAEGSDEWGYLQKPPPPGISHYECNINPLIGTTTDTINIEEKSPYTITLNPGITIGKLLNNMIPSLSGITTNISNGAGFTFGFLGATSNIGTTNGNLYYAEDEGILYQYYKNKGNTAFAGTGVTFHPQIVPVDTLNLITSITTKNSNIKVGITHGNDNPYTGNLYLDNLSNQIGFYENLTGTTNGWVLRQTLQSTQNLGWLTNNDLESWPITGPTADSSQMTNTTLIKDAILVQLNTGNYFKRDIDAGISAGVTYYDFRFLGNLRDQFIPDQVIYTVPDNVVDGGNTFIGSTIDFGRYCDLLVYKGISANLKKITQKGLTGWDTSNNAQLILHDIGITEQLFQLPGTTTYDGYLNLSSGDVSYLIPLDEQFIHNGNPLDNSFSEYIHSGNIDDCIFSSSCDNSVLLANIGRDFDFHVNVCDKKVYKKINSNTPGATWNFIADLNNLITGTLFITDTEYSQDTLFGKVTLKGDGYINVNTGDLYLIESPPVFKFDIVGCGEYNTINYYECNTIILQTEFNNGNITINETSPFTIEYKGTAVGKLLNNMTPSTTSPDFSNSEFKFGLESNLMTNIGLTDGNLYHATDTGNLHQLYNDPLNSCGGVTSIAIVDSNHLQTAITSREPNIQFGFGAQPVVGSIRITRVFDITDVVQIHENVNGNLDGWILRGGFGDLSPSVYPNFVKGTANWNNFYNNDPDGGFVFQTTTGNYSIYIGGGTGCGFIGNIRTNFPEQIIYSIPDSYVNAGLTFIGSTLDFGRYCDILAYRGTTYTTKILQKGITGWEPSLSDEVYLENIVIDKNIINPSGYGNYVTINNGDVYLAYNPINETSDELIKTGNILANIFTYDINANITVPSNTVGRTGDAFLTYDNKLYQYDGTIWNLTVDISPFVNPGEIIIKNKFDENVGNTGGLLVIDNNSICVYKIANEPKKGKVSFVTNLKGFEPTEKELVFSLRMSSLEFQDDTKDQYLLTDSLINKTTSLNIEPGKINNTNPYGYYPINKVIRDFNLYEYIITYDKLENDKLTDPNAVPTQLDDIVRLTGKINIDIEWCMPTITQVAFASPTIDMCISDNILSHGTTGITGAISLMPGKILGDGYTYDTTEYSTQLLPRNIFLSKIHLMQNDIMFVDEINDDVFKYNLNFTNSGNTFIELNINMDDDIKSIGDLSHSYIKKWNITTDTINQQFMGSPNHALGDFYDSVKFSILDKPFKQYLDMRFTLFHFNDENYGNTGQIEWLKIDTRVDTGSGFNFIDNNILNNNLNKALLIKEPTFANQNNASIPGITFNYCSTANKKELLFNVDNRTNKWLDYKVYDDKYNPQFIEFDTVPFKNTTVGLYVKLIIDNIEYIANKNKYYTHQMLINFRLVAVDSKTGKTEEKLDIPNFKKIINIDSVTVYNRHITPVKIQSLLNILNDDNGKSIKYRLQYYINTNIYDKIKFKCVGKTLFTSYYITQTPLETSIKSSIDGFKISKLDSIESNMFNTISHSPSSNFLIQNKNFFRIDVSVQLMKILNNPLFKGSFTPISTAVCEVSLVSTSGSSYILDNFIMSSCKESNIDISRVLMLESGSWSFLFVIYGVEDASLVIQEMIDIQTYVTPLPNILDTIYVKKPLYFSNVIPGTTSQVIAGCETEIVSKYLYPRNDNKGVTSSETKNDLHLVEYFGYGDDLENPALDRFTSFNIKNPGEYYIYSTFDAVEPENTSDSKVRPVQVDLYLAGPNSSPFSIAGSGSPNTYFLASHVVTTDTYSVLSSLNNIKLNNPGQYNVYAKFSTEEPDPQDINVTYGKVSLDVIHISNK